MRGNSHVRFGAGDEETCLGNGARCFTRYSTGEPVRTLTFGVSGASYRRRRPRPEAWPQGEPFPQTTQRTGRRRPPTLVAEAMPI